MIGELNHPVENEYFSNFNITEADGKINFAPRYTIDENGKIDVISIDVVLPTTNIETIGNYNNDK